MKPNKQVSWLDDGKILLPACGEIDEYFCRSNFKIHNDRYLVMTTMYESTLQVKPAVAAAASPVFRHVRPS